MPEALVERAPRVRCYECGSDRIFSLCHHCQLPMCEEHSPPAFRQGGALVRTPRDADEDARPVSKEFTGLRLGALREGVYHCEDHAHKVRGGLLPWIGLGGGTAALGYLLLLLAATTAGVLLLLIGAIVLGAVLVVDRPLPAGASRLPLPIVPHVNTVAVTERLTGYVRLEDGEYTSTVGSVAGDMRINVSTKDGHLLLQAYRKKFKLPEPEPVRFTGGYLMLRGEVGLAFRAGQPSVLAGGTGIAIGGDSADEHELFPTDPELPQCESTFTLDYELAAGRRPREIPLWIVPSLVPGTDRRTLEVDLHWNRLGTRKQRLSLSRFDLIELEVPTSWGNVESFAPGQVEIGRSTERRVIRWKQLKPDQPGASSLTLKLRFERPITEIDAASGATTGDPARPDEDGSRTKLTLAGTVEATFNGLLSGVTGVGVFLPGGGASHNRPRTTMQTKVATTFDASLRSIRYQDERVVPDENHPDDVAYSRNRTDEFPGVVPDYRTVTELTNAISTDNYYVKTVVEHPPHRDDGRSGVMKRVWHVTGRRYIGLFPIDFNISLRGGEASTADGFSGTTVAQVTVKGAYAVGTMVDRRGSTNPVDATAEPGPATEDADGPGYELLRQIEDTWTGLHARVTQLLADRAARAGRIGGSPENVLFGEVIEPGSGGPDGVVTIGAGEQAPAAKVLDVAPDHSAGRAADLRQQWKNADEAVVLGRISEDTHRGIVARIEAELNELRRSS